MKVVILAAGRGKRMGEYTEKRTKAMLPIKNTNEHGNSGNFSNSGKPISGKPILQITIEECVKAGMNDFIIVVGYRKRDIIDHFGDGSQYNANIKYVTQHNICAGTANAVQCAQYFFNGYDSIEEDTPFFLIYGDVVPTTKDIEKMTQTFKQSNSGVMAVRTVDDPQRYGVVELNGNNSMSKSKIFDLSILNL